MRLAPLRPEDRSRVSELLVATAAFSSEEVDVALELFDATFEKLCRPERSEGPALPFSDYEFIGAYDDQHLLGYACFGATPATEGTYDLYWLAVDPAAQGRGAGRALVQWVERELSGRAARLLVVETSSRPTTSYQSVYARGGYVEAARVRDADRRTIDTLTTRLTTRGRSSHTMSD